MNKRATPKQLELTDGKTREELLVQSLPSDIDPDSPEYKADLAKVDKIEKEEAARAVLDLDLTELARRSGFVIDQTEENEFNWNDPEEEGIILREQRATAVYRNRFGHLIIRQKCWPDDDTFVFVAQECETDFLERLAMRARET